MWTPERAALLATAAEEYVDVRAAAAARTLDFDAALAVVAVRDPGGRELDGAVRVGDIAIAVGARDARARSRDWLRARLDETLLEVAADGAPRAPGIATMLTLRRAHAHLCDRVDGCAPCRSPQRDERPLI